MWIIQDFWRSGLSFYFNNRERWRGENQEEGGGGGGGGGSCGGGGGVKGKQLLLPV